MTLSADGCSDEEAPVLSVRSGDRNNITHAGSRCSVSIYQKIRLTFI